MVFKKYLVYFLLGIPTAIFLFVFLVVIKDDHQLNISDFVSAANRPGKNTTTENTQKDFDVFIKKALSIPDIGHVYGGIVPHHALAGQIPATFFNNLTKQNVEHIILISPNHYNTGNSNITIGSGDWLTPFGILPGNITATNNLKQNQNFGFSADAFTNEHGINNLLPFIKYYLPQTDILPIIIGSKTKASELNILVNSLKDYLADDTVIISSVDFSHYLPWSSANFHDEISRATIQNFDFEKLPKLDVDSWQSIYVLEKLLLVKKATKIGYELNSNSAILSGRPFAEQTVSYFSPYFTAGDTPKIKSIASLLFFGDMMLDRSVKIQIDKNKSPDYLFTKIADEEGRLFLGPDIIHANLEGPFADSRRTTSKSIAFRFEPKLISTLKKYGFNLFTLANNHSLDMSRAGFNESKKNLTSAGVESYGQQITVDKNSVLNKTINGINISFIGLDDTITHITQKEIDRVFSYTTNTDWQIVNIHWGNEYKPISNSHQRELAHQLVDAGADIIIGHHPHVVEEMEIYKDKPIFYSLGNFIFDQYFSVPTQESLAVGAVLSTPTEKNNLSLYIYPLGQNRSQPYLKPPEQAYDYLQKWGKNCRIDPYKIENFNIKI